MKADYIDHMGDDLRVVNAARVSFNKESEWCVGETTQGVVTREDQVLNFVDTRLIRYLATHGHWTPFSHPMITVRETIPIFVARQRFKHMVGFTYNEVSRRYVDDEPEFFRPDEWRGKPEGSIKQGSAGVIPRENLFYGDFDDIPEAYTENGLNCYATNLYNWLLMKGVAPEQARMVLPQSMYTSFYVTGSLAAWARAYKQRIDSHAQKEIQELARQWGEILQPLFPVSWAALTHEGV